ncbi:hypothetical protein CWO92_21110 [Heyndrickxia camelliae]|uniref:Uncharacterized protein n=2 Tax=Heyndrickxia camelliae TaxID=1707093 RepID=A0A2N3LEN3_9BACI|nr:hypothetical protein CWO92_21110 [Heyndrickxia camelliae]
MKKYRLGYDYLFLPSKSFSYKEELIGAMSINVLFKVIDDDGNEKLFESEELKDQVTNLITGKQCYLYELFRCSVDKEKIVRFDPNIPLIKDFKYSLQFEINSYTKDLDKGTLEPVFISEAEFMEIMRNNFDLFDNVDNNSAQTTSYFIQEINP